MNGILKGHNIFEVKSLESIDNLTPSIIAASKVTESSFK